MGVITVVALLVTLYDYSAMVKSTQQQALHNRMATTFVVLRQSRATPCKARAALNRLAVAAVILVGLVMSGIVRFDVVQDTPEDHVLRAMTNSLQANASAAIADGSGEPTVVRLRESVLDVNNAFVLGQAGWEINESGTSVFGTDLRVGEHGIALGFGDEGIYAGVPMIIGGQIELENVRPYDSDHPFKDVLTAEGFERIIEDGLNGALAEHGLEPSKLVLENDVMILELSSPDA